jgi:hypothetical protein
MPAIGRIGERAVSPRETARFSVGAVERFDARQRLSPGSGSVQVIHTISIRTQERGNRGAVFSTQRAAWNT